MKSIYAIIPARSGSKGVSDKNISKLNGHPLIAWSILAAKKCKYIDRVIISTDSKEYASIAEDYGGEVPFIRPEIISGDGSTDYEFILHALDEFKELNEEPECLVHLRPTTPLRSPKVIDSAIKTFLDNSEFNSLRSVHEMPESSYKTLEVSENNELLPLEFLRDREIDVNSPRQLFPKTYFPNGYVDIIKTDYVRNEKKIHGEKCFAYITDVVTEVDTVEDFKYLEYQVENSDNIRDIFN